MHRCCHRVTDEALYLQFLGALSFKTKPSNDGIGSRTSRLYHLTDDGNMILVIVLGISFEIVELL